MIIAKYMSREEEKEQLIRELLCVAEDMKEMRAAEPERYREAVVREMRRLADATKNDRDASADCAARGVDGHALVSEALDEAVALFMSS